MVNGYNPVSLSEALELLYAREDLIPYAGGTDLMVRGEESASYLFINRIPELWRIWEDGTYLRVGAACTHAGLLENPLTPEFLKAALREIGAPAIRNLGTIGGNVCNGSSKADCVPVLFAMDAALRLVGARGERTVPVTEFYRGGGETVRAREELLAEVLIPKGNYGEYYYKKIGARRALAISRVSFAGLFGTADGKITRCAAAFGAVGPAVLRSRAAEALLLGRTPEEARGVKREFLNAYDALLHPAPGRVSAEYRKAVCRNLLEDFLDTFLGD